MVEAIELEIVVLRMIILRHALRRRELRELEKWTETLRYDLKTNHLSLPHGGAKNKLVGAAVRVDTGLDACVSYRFAKKQAISVDI